jgi:hypothetical protein
MSIMDMFRSKAVAPAMTPPTPQNNTVPNAGNTPNTEKSPLDNYAKLWDKPEGATSPSPTLVPALNMDPQKLRENAAKIDFVSQISSEQIQKAMSGDAAAFMQVINQATQLGFAQSVAASAEVTKQSLTSAQTSLNDKILPAAIRNQQITEAMREANPAFDNPAVAPLLSSLKDQFAAKYPTAAPSEIAKMAKDYLAGTAELITGQKVTQESGAPKSQLARPQEDWEKFFGTTSS